MGNSSKVKALAHNHEALCGRVASHGGKDGITGMKHKLKDACATRMAGEVAAGMISQIKSREQVYAEHLAAKAEKEAILSAAGVA